MAPPNRPPDDDDFDGIGSTAIDNMDAIEAALRAEREGADVVRNVRDVASTTDDVAEGVGNVTDLAGRAAGALHADQGVRDAIGAVDDVASVVGSVAGVVGSVGQIGDLIGDLIGSPLPEVTYRFESTAGSDTTWKVVRVHLEEGLSETYEARLELAADEASADPDELLGQPCKLTMLREAHCRLLFGVVRRVEHTGTAAGHRLCRVYVVPALWSLSQRTDSRIFQKVGVQKIVATLLNDAGLYRGDKLEWRLQGEYLPREYCVQYQETDLDFFRRLLEEEGIIFYFEHFDGSERLVLTDHPRAYPAIETLDGQAVPVAGPEAGTLHTESIRHLDWSHDLRPTGTTVRDYDFTRPTLDLTRHSAREPGERAQYEHSSEVQLAGYAGAKYGQDNSARQAQVRQEVHSSREQTGSGTSAVTGFCPGFTFELSGHGRPELDRRYAVTRVVHDGVVPEELPHETHHEGADRSRDRYRNHFECVSSDAPWRPERRTTRPRIHGMQSARVVGPEGEEIYTDEHGRIQVQFHWDRDGAYTEGSTCSIRVQQPWAGAGWGFVFLPRIGMEVIVSFLEGNPDRPVVLGCLYNGENTPPYTLPHDKTKSTIKTRSSPNSEGFNELRFEDLAGHEQVYLHAQKNLDEVVRNDHTTSVGHDQTNHVRHDHKEQVGNDQTLEVKGNRKKEVLKDEETIIHQNRTETVIQNERIEIQQNQRIVVGGTRSEEVTGKESIMLHDDRVTTVHKNDFLTVTTGERNVRVAASNDNLAVAGNKSVWIDHQYNISAVDQFRVEDGRKDQLCLAGGIYVYSPYRIQIKKGPEGGAPVGWIDMHGNDMEITAKGYLKLTCGQASMTLHSDGKIEINASSSNVEVKGGTIKLNE